MVILFAPFHVEMMALSPERAAEVRPRVEALARLGQAGWVRTIVRDSVEGRVEVLGVAGVAPLAGGDGEVFVVMAEPARRGRVEFVKGVRQLLEQARGHFATIRALGDEGNARWLSWLGFKKDGVEGNLTRWRLA